MRFVSLQSGSAGNCFLIQTKNINILIDVGITEKQLIKRLGLLNLKPQDINYVLVTHEHTDHISGLGCFSDEIIFATEETLPMRKNINKLTPYRHFCLDSVHIVPISMSHDVNNGVGYLIHDGDESLLYLTDTGYVKKDNIPFMQNCDYYILEANHNVDMVKNSKRPYFLKKRILSRKGHLSNQQCGEILSKVIGNNTKGIVLAHISGECNTPELCLKEVTEELNSANCDTTNIEIVVANRKWITYGMNAFRNYYESLERKV